MLGTKNSKTQQELLQNAYSGVVFEFQHIVVVPRAKKIMFFASINWDIKYCNLFWPFWAKNTTWWPFFQTYIYTLMQTNCIKPNQLMISFHFNKIARFFWSSLTYRWKEYGANHQLFSTVVEMKLIFSNLACKIYYWL